LYAEHAPRPAHLLPTPEDDQSDHSHSSDDDPGLGEYLTIAEQAAKAEKRGKKDGLKDDMWDEEVEHLTMSVKLWSLVCPDPPFQSLLFCHKDRMEIEKENDKSLDSRAREPRSTETGLTTG
jgi:origin recognition complex subunit 5